METSIAADETVQAGWRKLAYLLDRPSPASHGVSTTALQRMIVSVEALAEIPDPVSDAGARRVLRYLACLVPSEVPQSKLADIITQVADHPQLPLTVVREILRGEGEGEGREVSADKLRLIADLLRAGHTKDDILARVGGDRNVIGSVSVFLGVVDARAEALQDAAAEWVATDAGSIAAFAREQGIGRTYAGDLIHAAKAAEEMPL